MSTATRSMSADERAVLSHLTRSAAYRDLIGPCIFGGGMMCLIIFIVLSYLGDWIFPHLGWPNPREIRTELLITAVLITATYLGNYMVGELRHIRKFSARYDQVEHDLREGITEVRHFEVRAVVEIEEYEDEGAAFLLELIDGRTLCVRGQHYYPYSLTYQADPEDAAEERIGVFPSDVIETVTAPASGVLLAVTGVRNYLRPQSIVRYGVDGPADGPEGDKLYDLTIEEVVTRFGLAKQIVS